MTGPATLDRRQRKSRAALQQALLDLVAEHPYADITIEDITERADVARATFYAHYRDKPSLLHEASRELIEGLTASAGSRAARTAVYDAAAIIATFEHADAHRGLFRIVLSGEGGPAIRRELIAAYERTVASAFSHLATVSSDEPRVPLQVTTTAFAGALLWTVESWLDDPGGRDATAAAVDFLRGQMGGLEWCLGFAHGETTFAPPPAPG